MSKALITAAGANLHEMLSYSEPTFRQYADIHGYELIVERNINDSPERDDVQALAARWAKVGIIKKALTQYDLVVWLDADAMITRFDKDITDDFDENCFQAFVLEQFPTRFNPNSGVWAVRRDPMATEFLEAIQAIGQVGTIFADQGAICTALGWEVARKTEQGIVTKPAHYSKYLARTGWLPPEWNPLGMAAKWPYRVQHFAGMQNDERTKKMRDLYLRLIESGSLSK